MEVRTLDIALSQSPGAGWHQDPDTGQWHYYDEEGRRYVYVAGLLYPAVAWEPAPKVVNVRHGDSLRITVSFKYSGPAKTAKLYGAIGNLGNLWPYTFDEILTGISAGFTLPEASSPISHTRDVTIPVTTAIAAGKGYSIYVKLIDGVSFKEGETSSVALRDAVFVVSAEPAFSEFSITDYAKV